MLIGEIGLAGELREAEPWPENINICSVYEAIERREPPKGRQVA